MIRKLVAARDESEPAVAMWGSGRPSREFLYVEDAARALLLAAEHLDRSEPVNIGTGVETRIDELAQLIGELVGYRGQIDWDRSQPDGQPSRRLDVSRARELIGFQAQTDLATGLRHTIEWYQAQIQQHGSDFEN
jgi:GDP-L-fucose synthase